MTSFRLMSRMQQVNAQPSAEGQKRNTFLLEWGSQGSSLLPYSPAVVSWCPHIWIWWGQRTCDCRSAGGRRLLRLVLQPGGSLPEQRFGYRSGLWPPRSKQHLTLCSAGAFSFPWSSALIFSAIAGTEEINYLKFKQRNLLDRTWRKQKSLQHRQRIEISSTAFKTSQTL